MLRSLLFILGDGHIFLSGRSLVEICVSLVRRGTTLRFDVTVLQLPSVLAGFEFLQGFLCYLGCGLVCQRLLSLCLCLPRFRGDFLHCAQERILFLSTFPAIFLCYFDLILVHLVVYWWQEKQLSDILIKLQA